MVELLRRPIWNVENSQGPRTSLLATSYLPCQPSLNPCTRIPHLLTTCHAAQKPAINPATISSRHPLPKPSPSTKRHHGGVDNSQQTKLPGNGNRPQPPPYTNRARINPVSTKPKRGTRAASDKLIETKKPKRSPPARQCEPCSAENLSEEAGRNAALPESSPCSSSNVRASFPGNRSCVAW